MNTNPYQPPSPESVAKSDVRSNRDSAERKLRLSITVLMVSALMNVVIFSLNAPPIFALINIGGTLIVGFAAWRFSVPILERCSSFLHRKFSRNSKREEWIEELYTTLMTTLPFAILGAILWAVWVFLIYIAKANFFAVSVPVGICAHVLGAGVYLQLPFRWWKIERIAPAANAE